MTREEHLTWCKNQAKLSAQKGETVQVLWSEFLANMHKHEETRNHPMLLPTGRMVTKGFVLYAPALIEHLNEYV
jgi:invasion protein IalB